MNQNKNNESLKDRKYLYAPMEYEKRILPIKLTVKEYKDIWAEKRLYAKEEKHSRSIRAAIHQ